MRTLSDAALISANASTTDVVWLLLLTISHPDLEAPIRVANNTEDIDSQGFTFVGVPLSIELPGDDPDDPGQASVEIDNIDPIITTTLRSIPVDDPPSVTLQVILAENPDVVELEFTDLKLREATYDATAVKGMLRYETLITEPVCEIITPQRFPGLF